LITEKWLKRSIELIIYLLITDKKNHIKMRAIFV